MVRKALGSFICALVCSLPVGGAWADGAVYAMTNALESNQILVYHRTVDGSFSQSAPVQTIATGGGGSGLQLAGVDTLGSAGSLQLDKNHRFLFAVNTESAKVNNGSGLYNSDCQQGTITSFRINPDGTLTFADRVFSGGLFPNSLAVRKRQADDADDHRHGEGDRHDDDDNGDLVYVLNAGGPRPPAVCQLMPSTANTPNVTGFRVDQAGHMIPLDSTQPIDPGPASGSGENCSAASAAGFQGLTGAPAADFQCGLNPPSFIRSPAQVRFTPSGDRLVVTVKGTNTIYVFPLDEDARVGSPAVMQAALPALPTYFGFTFDRGGHLLVTETFGSATTIPAGGKGSVSSFTIQRNGALVAISSHVADGGTAACWIALEPTTERFAYVANNLSASITSYTVSTGGTVTLLNGVAAVIAGPNDLATAAEGASSFLYAVSSATGTVAAYHINGDGSLAPILGGTGLPTFAAQGLAAY